MTRLFHVNYFILVLGSAILVALGIIYVAVDTNPAVYQIFQHGTAYNRASVYFHGYNLETGVILLWGYSLTTILGTALTYKTLRQIVPGEPEFIYVIAGFQFGFLGVIGIARLVTLFLGVSASYVVTSILIVGISASLLYQTRTRKGENPQVTPGFQVFMAALVICVFVTVLLLQVYQADFIWAGHGVPQYADEIPSLHHEARFPLVTQHYDELLYHYWLTTPAPISNTHPIIPWWITLGIVKTSVFSFLYLFFRALAFTRFKSLLFGCFLMVGTSSILPTKYYLLFDSSNPLYYTAHSGRIVGVTVLLLLLLHHVVPASPRLPTVALALIALGLTATSISNSIWMVSICILLFFLEQTEMRETGILREVFPFVVLVIVTLIGFYALPISSLFLQVRLGLALLMPMLALAICELNYRIFSTILTLRRQTLLSSQPFLFVVFSIIGLLFLGNLFVQLPTGSLTGALSSITGHRVEALSLTADLTGTSEHVTVLGDYREAGLYTVYHDGAGAFAAVYGIILILLLIIGVSVAHVRRLNTAGNIFVLLTIIAMSAMPFLFLFIDFTPFGIRSWIKTRFLEIPYYIILVSGLYIIGKFLTDKFWNYAASFLILLYMVAPIVFTGRPQQIYANWRLLHKIVADSDLNVDFYDINVQTAALNALWQNQGTYCLDDFYHIQPQEFIESYLRLGEAWWWRASDYQCSKNPHAQSVTVLRNSEGLWLATLRLRPFEDHAVIAVVRDLQRTNAVLTQGMVAQAPFFLSASQFGTIDTRSYADAEFGYHLLLGYVNRDNYINVGLINQGTLVAYGIVVTNGLVSQEVYVPIDRSAAEVQGAAFETWLTGSRRLAISLDGLEILHLSEITTFYGHVGISIDNYAANMAPTIEFAPPIIVQGETPYEVDSESMLISPLN